MPRIVCGSSVGSIIAAYIACHKYEDLPKVLEITRYIEKPFLRYKCESPLQALLNLFKGEAVLDTVYL
jgi:TAG lipase/steryl ester hydrolase/phospholipase A2/LPA acyltransferase